MNRRGFLTFCAMAPVAAPLAAKDALASRGALSLGLTWPEWSTFQLGGGSLTFWDKPASRLEREEAAVVRAVDSSVSELDKLARLADVAERYFDKLTAFIAPETADASDA